MRMYSNFPETYSKIISLDYLKMERLKGIIFSKVTILRLENIDFVIFRELWAIGRSDFFFNFQ